MDETSNEAPDERLSSNDTDTLRSSATHIQGCEDSANVTMETVWRELGSIGKYQLIQISCACLALLPYVFVMLNFVFIAHEPSHTCQLSNDTELLRRYDLRNDETAKISYNPCTVSLSSNRTGRTETIVIDECIAYSYTERKSFSMVTEWDLSCGKRSLGHLLQTMTTVGVGIGSVVFTFVGDRYGRKKVYLPCLAALFVTELTLYFSPSIYVAYGLRLLSGVASGGMIFLQLVPCMELITSKYRQIFGMVNCILRSVCLMFLAGVAYALKDYGWRYLQVATAATCVPPLIGAFVFNETPVWYFAKGRYDDAERTLRKACRMNGKNWDTVRGVFRLSVSRATSSTSRQSATSSQVKVCSPLDIVRNRHFFLMVGIVCIIWFNNSLAYYGLFLTSSTLAGDRFLNFFLMGALELPSSLVNMVLLCHLERRSVVLIFTAMSGVCLLVSTVLVAIGSNSTAVGQTSTAFSLLGKFAVGSCYNVIYVYTPEVFPTTIRSTGTSICATFARISGMLAPFLISLFHISPWAPGTILTSLSIVSFLIIPLLPETRGKELPTTIDDVMDWKELDEKCSNKYTKENEYSRPLQSV